MSSGSIPFALAHEAASLFLANVGHVCREIVIAGSLRRHLSAAGGLPRRVPAHVTVGDIEIVAHPQTLSALWDHMDLLRYPLAETKDKKGRTTLRCGPKFRKYLIPTPGDKHWLVCDLYLADASNWGYILALRTGPADGNFGWTAQLVTAQSKRGLRPEHIALRDGYVYRQEESGLLFPIPVPSEKAFFRAMDLPWLEPHERSASVAEGLRRAAARVQALEAAMAEAVSQ